MKDDSNNVEQNHEFLDEEENDGSNIDEPELLDDESENNYDYEYNDGSDQVDPNEYANQEENSKFGEDAFKEKNGNKNYYKENNEKLKERKEEEKEKKEKANEDLEKAKERKKEAKENKREAKDGDKEDKKAARQEYKEAKKDVKKSQREKKEADKAIRDANRRITQNKIKSMQSKAYEISHPIASTKEHLKQKAKRSIEAKLITFIKKHPYILIFLGLALFLSFFGIIIFAVLSGGNLGSFEGTSFGSRGYTSCNYGKKGINDETIVELINCEATKDNYNVLQKIPLEKYIAGVAIAEIGEDTLNNEEALKAQIIATRSYTLTRNIPEYSVGYDSAKNVIRMRACENDQVYWDYTKDLYRSGGGVAKYSPYEYTPSEGEKPWKRALTEEQIKKYEDIYESVLGKYAADANGNVVLTKYSTNAQTHDGETDKFRILAEQNKGTINGEYTSIIMNVYPGVTQIKDTECSLTLYDSVGDYSKWKQKCTLGGQDWCNVKLGTKPETTINNIGCYVTSIAMVIAHSGVPTTIENFNPGTFAQALKSVESPKTFADGGGLNNKGNIAKFVPNYNNITLSSPLPDSKQGKIDELRKHAEAGEYIILIKRGHSHFLVMDNKGSAESGWTTIKVWDPASLETDMFKTYGTNGITHYRIMSFKENN